MIIFSIRTNERQYIVGMTFRDFPVSESFSTIRKRPDTTVHLPCDRAISPVLRCELAKTLAQFETSISRKHRGGKQKIQDLFKARLQYEVDVDVWRMWPMFSNASRCSSSPQQQRAVKERALPWQLRWSGITSFNAGKLGRMVRFSSRLHAVRALGVPASTNSRQILAVEETSTRF